MSLESGLIHANRVGDMDTSMSYFLKDEGLSDEEILQGLQKKGGLLGISGVSNDLRYVLEAAEEGNERAALAVDVFVTGIVHYIGAFAMDLGKLDYLVFTAGIGEHSDYIREKVCAKLNLLGVKLDEEANRRSDEVISAAESKVKVLVIPTNEELGIARRTYEYR
jgi:acetate kinase